MHNQHEEDHLCDWEGDWEFIQLLRIVQHHDAIAQLVVHPRQDWRGNFDDIGYGSLINDSLNPL